MIVLPRLYSDQLGHASPFSSFMNFNCNLPSVTTTFFWQTNQNPKNLTISVFFSLTAKPASFSVNNQQWTYGHFIYYSNSTSSNYCLTTWANPGFNHSEARVWKTSSVCMFYFPSMYIKIDNSTEKSPQTHSILFCFFILISVIL